MINRQLVSLTVGETDFLQVELSKVKIELWVLKVGNLFTT